MAAAAALGVSLGESQLGQLQQYVELLEHWNSRFNLLSRQDIGRIWTRHVLDSLSLLPLLPPGRLLDVGTGAGFPGLPLAIAAPELNVLLVDRSPRKIRFLELVVHTLGLDNANCLCCDVAKLPGQKEFDVVVSRAVAAPAILWGWTRHLVAEQGCLVLMTGVCGALEPDADEEIVHADPVIHIPGAAVERTHEIVIPGLDRAHEVMIIRPVAS